MSRRWGRGEAGHLLRRAAFAPRPGEVDRVVADGPRVTVDRLLGGEKAAPQPAARNVEFGVRQLNDREATAGALLNRIVTTTEPLRERLVLFFHNHFVSALSKVQESRMMLDQLRLFRRSGPGPFAELVRKISRDPAMVRYLDSERSTRNAPNENFARELMELFTMGPGPYTEKDIQEAARAFTGYHLRGGRFRQSTASFDDGNKTVLGRTGALTGDQVCDFCSGHPATARFMARKLARAFVTDTPDTPLVDAIAALWKAHHGHVGKIMRAMLTSPRFYDDRYRFALTRSPADLVVAALRTTGVNIAPRNLAGHVQAMGQTLVDAPTVKGYDGGAAWLNPASLLARRSFLLQTAHQAMRQKKIPMPEKARARDRLLGLAEHILGKKLEPRVFMHLEKMARAKRTSPDAHVLALTLCHPDFQRC